MLKTSFHKFFIVLKIVICFVPKIISLCVLGLRFNIYLQYKKQLSLPYTTQILPGKQCKLTICNSNLISSLTFKLLINICSIQTNRMIWKFSIFVKSSFRYNHVMYVYCIVYTKEAVFNPHLSKVYWPSPIISMRLKWKRSHLTWHLCRIA